MNKLKQFLKWLWFIITCIFASGRATVKYTPQAGQDIHLRLTSPKILSGSFDVYLRTYQPHHKSPFQKRFVIACEKSSRITAAMQRRIAMLLTTTNDELKAMIEEP